MMFLFLLFLVIFNKLVYKSSLNPIFLQSLLWLVYYVLLAANINSYNVRLDQMTDFISIQSIGFSLGGLICFLFTHKTIALSKISLPVETENEIITQKNLLFLFPFFLTLLCISLFLLIKSGGSASITNLADIRQNLTEDDGKKYGTYGLIQFLISVYLILYYSTKKQSSVRFTIFSILFFYFTALLGAKAAFLFFFSALLYVLLWQKRISKIKVLYSIAFILALFIVITLLRISSTDSGYLLDILLIYSITSLPGLVMSSSHVASPFFGYQTFRVLYLWLNKLGFSIPIAPVLLQFTYTPLPTNVYSYIRPYYTDFGYWGVFLLPLFLGFLHNFIYFKAKMGKVGFIVLNALLVYPLIMQFFDDQYFRWISNWVYFSILIYIITAFKLNELGIRRRKKQLG